MTTHELMVLIAELKGHYLPWYICSADWTAKGARMFKDDPNYAARFWRHYDDMLRFIPGPLCEV